MVVLSNFGIVSHLQACQKYETIAKFFKTLTMQLSSLKGLEVLKCTLILGQFHVVVASILLHSQSLLVSIFSLNAWMKR